MWKREKLGGINHKMLWFEGKTYLACALGVVACRLTYRVLYIRMPDLMRNFENQSDNLRELTKYRKRIEEVEVWGTFLMEMVSKGVGMIIAHNFIKSSLLTKKSI